MDFTPDEVAQLKLAIDTDDLARVAELITANPALHHAPLGYAQDGPLTWAAECRVPFAPPSPERLAIVRWLIENGSDIHRGGDAPLMRAALNDDRLPMMKLLVSLGADVNASWHGHYPIINAACEGYAPQNLTWLLAHGAHPGTALDFHLGTYVRDTESIVAIMDILLAHGATTKYNFPEVLAIIRHDQAQLATLLDAHPDLLHRHYPTLDIGSTGGRLLTLAGATLLHVAAEFQNLPAATLLLERGLPADTPALIAPDGSGGQTALFHAATQNDAEGLPIVQLLLAHGANPHHPALVPGHYEHPGQLLQTTPAAYSLLFPGGTNPVTQLLNA